MTPRSRQRFFNGKKNVKYNEFPFLLLASKRYQSQRDRLSLHTNPRIIILRGVSQEKYQSATMRYIPSASTWFLPVLPFRRIGLPSRSPLMGTTVILYSVPGCRPGNKQPVLGVSAGSRPLVPSTALPRASSCVGEGRGCASCLKTVICLREIKSCRTTGAPGITEGCNCHGGAGPRG